MADQKELKRRLKILMQKPENQICSDCPERQPRWASLIVPPPGSPPGSSAIGAFCCLECSGSHRRLGVHISFVRSVNLDSWKEKEVLAMENGGNRKVNAIWEANLERAGGHKPPTGADLTTRERYIRDKYERRRFYDPQALVDYQNNEPSIDDLVTRNPGGSDFASFGPPPTEQVSDAAKMRAEKKKKKSIPRNRSFEAPARQKSGSKKVIKKQESEPIDLLDFGSAAPAPAPTSNGSTDPFADFAAASAAPPPPAAGSSESRPRSRTPTRSEKSRTKSKTPDRDRTRKAQQQDILNMYNAPLGGNTGGMNNNNNNMGNNQMNQMMAMMQQMNMNPQQQMQQPGFGGGSGGGHESKSNSRLAAHQNLMVQQQQQNMQRMMQQQQQQQHQGAGGFGGMNPNMMMNMNPQMMQMMMNQMQQQMSANNNMMGGGIPSGSSMMQVNPNMMGMNSMMHQPQQQQMNQLGGMPMGGMAAPSGQAAANKAPEKEDPFAQFGMNAFR